jgi:citrate lyase subunit beta / citryl-CoA lyase
MTIDPTSARSYLFVPATRPDRVGKALASGADAVVVDLEDAVAETDKAAARQSLGDLAPAAACVVRVNGADTPHHRADMAAVAALDWVSAVLVPKVEDPDVLDAVRAALAPGRLVLAIVESARGILAADAIAAGGAARLVFGVVDFLADVGVGPGPEVLLYPRSRLVLASVAAGLPRPIDGPHLAIADAAGLAADAAAARALGFGGKVCIHPTQVAIVNDAFAPSAAEVHWARGVLAAAAVSSGVFIYEGAMVDEPVLRRARSIVAGAPSEPGQG